MATLFDASDRQSILSRLDQLRPASQREWGKMQVGQMLAHCANALEVPTGERVRKQALIGKVLAPFVRKKVLGQEPFSRNAPTDPTFVIRDDRDFDTERTRLRDGIRRFAERGPEAAGRATHSFFGQLSGDEWGVLMYKHLDHHLRQFGQ